MAYLRKLLADLLLSNWLRESGIDAIFPFAKFDRAVP